MGFETKGISPFFPGQPVPAELFVGRSEEIRRIERAAYQVSLGRPKSVFITGEYGIGKSSLASYMKNYCELKYDIVGPHVFLQNNSSISDMTENIIKQLIREKTIKPNRSESIRNFLSKYISEADLFVFRIDVKALQSDLSDLSKGFLPFLDELYSRLKDDGVKGLILILDEINGITKDPEFAHFIKSFVDDNAVNYNIPILLLLCGVEERLHDMIQNHPPIERIFDIAELSPLSQEETREFFKTSFENRNIDVEEKALEMMTYYSAGFPKLLHILGDSIFWANEDDIIDHNDASVGIIRGADEIGRKFFNKQIISALQSKDYLSILKKVTIDPETNSPRLDLTFTKKDSIQFLNKSEQDKFDNFIQRLKNLKVISSHHRGEYTFNNRLFPLYVFLSSAGTK